MYTEEESTLNEVRQQVTNVQGETPSIKAVWSAVKRVENMAGDDLVPGSN